VDRIRRRYEDPAMADRFLSQPQLPVVWRFVQELNRPEVRFVTPRSLRIELMPKRAGT
jgi:hypothetical protein